MKKIFVALSTFAKEGSAPLDMLVESGLPFMVNRTGKRLSADQLMIMAPDAYGIVAGLEVYDASLLAKLPQLKCISRCGVGVDNVDLKEARARGIVVLNTPQVVVQPVAEMTLALIFDCLRKISAHDRLMRQGQWERLGGFQLAGKTAGIIGLGRIGRRVAELLTRLEVKVIAYDIAPDLNWVKAHDIAIVGLPRLLKTADIVTLHLAGDVENPFCLSGPDLMVMKQGSILINTARGSFIDEEALGLALREGPIAACGLDVYTKEPYQGVLSQLPNTVLTPHCSTLTKESRLSMEVEAVENILKYVKES